MEWSHKWIRRPGQSLVELLVALGLAAILIPAFMAGMMASREGRAQQEQRLAATASLREAVEAVRAVRSRGWTSFAVNGVYHPVVEVGSWKLRVGDETTTEGLTRSVVISDYLRNGQIDPSAKSVTVTVSWTTPLANSVTSTLVLTRYLENLTHVETTQAQFDAGIKTDVVSTNTAGGEIQLKSAAGGWGDWCAPNLSIAALDLPRQGIATAISAAYGHAYTTTGGNSSGDSMDSVSVSDPPAPTAPVAINDSSYNNYKTYGVFVDENNVYLTSDHPGLTVDIVGVTKPYTQKGTFDAGGKGISVFASGSTGYVTSGSSLYTFDLTSFAKLGSVALAGTGNRVVVVGQKAYVATSSTTSQLQIVDVADPRNMTVMGGVDVGNGKGGIDVAVDSGGTNAYLATNYASLSQPDVFIISLSSKSVTRSYNTNGMDPKGIAFVPLGRIIVVGSGGDQYQVFNTTSVSVSACGHLANPNGASSVNAVNYVREPDGDVFSYILTNNAGKEFQIIAGGSGGSGGGEYVASGTFESAAWDPGYSTSYNRISFTAATPSQTSLTAQVAVAADCQNYNFVGPDGTSGTYYSAPGGAVPIGASAGRCFKYKLYLTTSNPTVTPIFYDLTVNYSP